VFECKTQDALEKLKEIPTDHHVIAIEFENSESYCTHAPVYREMFKMMPEIMRKLKRRQDLLYARYFYSLTANLPIAIQKLMEAVMIKRIANRRKAIRNER